MNTPRDASQESGRTRPVTKAELENLRREQCDATGGTAGVIRSDNHRELLRRSLEETTGKYPTEEAVDEAARRLRQPAVPSWCPQSPDAQLRQDAESRIATFGRTTVALESFDAPGREAAGEDPAACFKLACEGCLAGGTRLLPLDKPPSRVYY